MNDFNLTLLIDDQEVETLTITETIEPFSNAEFQFLIPQDFSTAGDYNLMGIVSDVDDEYGNNDTLNYVVTKIHQLDAGVSIGGVNETCNNEIEATIIIENNGGNTINNVMFEIIINGESVGDFYELIEIPSLTQVELTLVIEDNIQANDNEVVVNIIGVNGEVDGEV